MHYKWIFQLLWCCFINVHYFFLWSWYKLSHQDIDTATSHIWTSACKTLFQSWCSLSRSSKYLILEDFEISCISYETVSCNIARNSVFVFFVDNVLILDASWECVHFERKHVSINLSDCLLFIFRKLCFITLRKSSLIFFMSWKWWMWWTTFDWFKEFVKMKFLKWV